MNATTAQQSTHPNYDRLITAARHAGPVTVAVAHPCDRNALEAALDAAEMGLIKPILVGPRARIQKAADDAQFDISALTLIDTAHSHASAARAVELVREGRAQALMKGSLHTDELMGAVVAADTGLRTARRLSHCFIMDVPGRSEPLIITDAAVNINPGLSEKADIVQNAIDLALVLKFDPVKVAILAAVETVSAKMPSTIDAAALCKMADRGQITGAILDGPLAMDNAIDPAAAAIKNLVSPVAGQANVLIAPDLEAGNMLAKSLTFMAGAGAAGIVLGARVPVILTSRADSVEARLASCAVAVLLVHSKAAVLAATGA